MIPGIIVYTLIPKVPVEFDHQCASKGIPAGYHRKPHFCIHDFPYNACFGSEDPMKGCIRWYLSGSSLLDHLFR
jgi:hypothetical protein